MATVMCHFFIIRQTSVIRPRSYTRHLSNLSAIYPHNYLELPLTHTSGAISHCVTLLPPLSVLLKSQNFSFSLSSFFLFFFFFFFSFLDVVNLNSYLNSFDAVCSVYSLRLTIFIQGFEFRCSYKKIVSRKYVRVYF